MIIDISKKEIDIKSNSKIGYILSDKIILLSKLNNDKLIENEYNMLLFLKSINLPIVPNLILVNTKSRNGNRLSLYEDYIKNTNLFKLSSNIYFFNNKIIEKIKNIIDIINKHKILIIDFQFIYNEDDLYIIDPEQIYIINDNSYQTIIDRSKKIDFNKLIIDFNKQNKVLNYIINRK
jgi:hypothetical protein